MAKTRSKKTSRKAIGESARISPILEALLKGFQRRFEDLGVVLFGLLAILSILSLTGLTRGDMINVWTTFLRRWLGWGAWLVPWGFLWVSIRLFRRRRGESVPIPWQRVISIEIWVISMLALVTILVEPTIPEAESGVGGGLIGWGLATLVGDLVGDLGALVFFLILSIISGLYTLSAVLYRLANLQLRSVDRESRPVYTPAPLEPSLVKTRRRPSRVPKEYRKNFQLPERVDDSVEHPAERDRRLPPHEIFDQGTYSRLSAKEINSSAGLIEKTLADFGLPVRVVDFKSGPSVTQFAVEPGYIKGDSSGESKRNKVRVSQISALANDLALALSAPRVRVEAPVPGRSYVGIEVPNRKSSIVRLGPILATEAFASLDSPLAIGLGRDVAGSAVVTDLASMPHLLIAGTTGSGKSVCITSITASLAFNNSPDQLRMVMIDPKIVELVRFNGLPHLIGTVETELERIAGVLRWVTREMDNRYRLLEHYRVRDIDRYNATQRRRRKPELMPRLVVMIDELADLMMMVPDQTEQTIVRLAQMARATGIHLVVATQRPSTDVVTGLIKANFPARISFAVASSIDSRVILDSAGAETLLGRGDMLFLSPEAASPIRLQGAYVSDLEIERLINYWKGSPELTKPEAKAEVPWEPIILRKAVVSDKDEIIERAIDVVRQSGEASASLLQRRLRIGYPRAARLMDELEELGVVGRPTSGGKTREILIGRDEDPLDPPPDMLDED
jgi:S-DNA-T family DNA segregation ATPase FtsK/SpoIIIE